MRNFGMRLVATACLSLSLLAPYKAALAASISASSAVVVNDGSGNGSVTTYGTGSPVSLASYTNTNGLAASGSAEADYGLLRASAFSAAVGAVPHVGLTAQTRGVGSAAWIDGITISSSTLTGQAFARAFITLSGNLTSLSGALNVGSVGNSTISSLVRINGTNVFSTTGQLVSRNGAVTINDMNRGQAVNGVFQSDPVTNLVGTFAFDIPFAFGTKFQMVGSLDAFTQALASVPGDVSSAYSSFGSSAIWGGISEVHLANGTVLSGYSISSESGFDWSKPHPITAAVPEPETYALMLAGLGLIGVVARRRKAKQA